MEDNQFPREIALCLSGGAAKGAFHLGVIETLLDYGIEIKAISGTSIGALIGASFISGKLPKEILHILKSKEFKKAFKLSLGNGYLYKIDMHNPSLDKLLNKKSFEELSIPFEIALTDIKNAKVEYRNSGDKLKEYILASCSITPVISPTEIDEMLYVDGGIIDNFPVKALKKYPYKILGVNLYPYRYEVPSSIFDWIKKVVFVAWQAPNLSKLKECDYYLSSNELTEISMFSFKDLDRAYELGKKETREYLKKYQK